MIDFYWTWDVFAAPIVMAIATAIIVNSLNRHFKVRDEKDLEIKRLLDEKDKARAQRQEKDFALVNTTLCAVKTKVDRIEDDLHKKVEWEYCQKQERIIQKRITEHIENHHTKRSTDRWPMGTYGESK